MCDELLPRKVLLGVLSAAPALAQDGILAPSQKTTGARKPQMEPSLIVMNATGAKLQAGKLILDGAAPNAIILADRPVPAAGHALSAHLLEPRDEGSDSSSKDRARPSRCSQRTARA